MATSIIPSIPLYTIHYPLPLYQAGANVRTSTVQTNLVTLPDATTPTAATASAGTAADTAAASFVQTQTNTDLSQLINLTANNTPPSVGSLIDLMT